MIVADTNVIAYFLIKSSFTPDARAVYQRDPEWVAPVLWLSELRNVFVQSIGRGLLGLNEAIELMRRAEILMKGHGYRVDSAKVMRLAGNSGCAAYDCEFVVLAQELGVPLVTEDRALIEKFKSTAISMRSFSI